jgi:hypothetical protein
VSKDADASDHHDPQVVQMLVSRPYLVNLQVNDEVKTTTYLISAEFDCRFWCDFQDVQAIA